jgi:PAS domain S-box-containing protein
LRHSERRYAATLASIGDAVISTDADERITYLNAVAESLTGCRSTDVLGRKLDEVYRLRDEETGLAISGINATVQSLLLECDRHGPVPIEQSASPIVDDRGHVAGTVLVFRDLSGRRAVEKALRDAQAELARVSGLTTMGELAASIAHEINQPLAAIVTNASAGLNWLRRPQPELAEIEQVLGGIVADGSRAAGVIRSLQALARKSGPDLARLDLHVTIHEVMALMRADLQRHRVRVLLQLGRFDSNAVVLADRIQLQQVLVNLLRNGMEAICESADPTCLLTIATEMTPTGEIATSVTDTGDGVPAQHLGRLFDAFFTTKPAGMGMGLAICRSIVEAHHGKLWAQPRSPRGTRMVFTLPAVTDTLQ